MEESTAKDNRRSLRQFSRGMGYVFLIAVVMLGLSKAGMIDQWEMFGIDSILRDPPAKSKDIWMVQITDEDYEDLFNSTSPLSREQLGKLIIAVARAHPKLIVVDLDVSDPPRGKDKTAPTQNEFIQDVQHQLEGISEPRPMIIWAQVTGPHNMNGRPVVVPPVGRASPSRLAVPLFPRGRDGVVRSYLRTVEVSYKGMCQRWPTLAWAAFSAYDSRDSIEPKDCTEKPKDESLFLNFSGDRFTFNRVDAGSLLEAKSTDAAGVMGFGGIAIIGGAYAAARDEYFTPSGPMQGMDLIAFALESEIHDKGVRPVDELYAFVLDLMVGAAIIGIGYRLSGWPSFASSVAAAFVLPIVCSYLVYKSHYFLLNFVPVALGALLHIVVETINEAKGKLQESDAEPLKAENAKLKEEVNNLKEANLVHAEQKPASVVTINVLQNVPPA